MPPIRSEPRARKPRARIVPIHAPEAPPIHPFDRMYGTDTGGLIPGAELATGSTSDEHITAYYAIAPSILNTLIDLWLQSGPSLAIDQYTLLDVGCGKGRAMMTAAQHPFRAVLGIEINPTLASIARANLQAFATSPASQSLSPIDVLEGDALAVPLPDGPTLVMMFHPFEAPVLKRFITRLQQHFDGRRGQLDILYVNAEHASLFDRNPAFERLFNGMVPMSSADHLADLAEIAEQRDYGSTGDEFCTIFRFTGRDYSRPAFQGSADSDLKSPSSIDHSR